MKKYFIVILLLITCIFLLNACNSENDSLSETQENTQDYTQAPTEDPTLQPTPNTKGIDISNFTMIRPENPGSSKYREIAMNCWINLRSKITLEFKDDWVKNESDADNDKYEILIGKTNRPESAEAIDALEGYYDYGIFIIGNKICIAAKTEDMLDAACELFLQNVTADDDTATYAFKETVIKTYDYTRPSLTVAGEDISSFSIVLSKEATSSEKTLANCIVEYLRLVNGVDMPILTDEASETEFEILIGNTERTESSAAQELSDREYLTSVFGKKLIIASSVHSGYSLISDRIESLFDDLSKNELYQYKDSLPTQSLDGKRVMFIGNSFIYYGNCVDTNGFKMDDTGYFKDVAKAMGDNVTVTTLTPGGSNLKSVYEELIKDYPNFYGSGNELDDIYKQDFVVLQQAGSNAESTEEYARKFMALFAPETKFAFFVHHHNVQNNHTYVIGTAEKLRDEGSAVYISQGHLIYDLWTNKVENPDATMKYNQDSFCVNQPNDRHHPNYLNGYLLALQVYHAFTDRSIVDTDSNFVSESLEFYKNGATSNYPQILQSESDMHGLKKLIEEYYYTFNN